MKKLISIILAIALCLATFCILTSCSSNKSSKTIKIGATPSPHAEILEYVKPILKEKGIELEIKVFNDYVLPNTAVENNELDANYFQHVPYLDDFNSKNGTHIVSIGAVHYEPFGIYAGKTTSLSALKDGATIAIPNDGTNESRALLLLAANGLIEVDDTVTASSAATKLNIKSNPHNYNIVEIEAAQLPAQLPSVDVAVINGNYAIGAGLKVKDALAVEDQNSDAAITYGNIIAVKAGNENNENFKVLLEVLTSDDVQAWITNKYEGAVVPSAKK